MKTKNNKTKRIEIRNLLMVHDLDVAKLARCIGRSRTWTSQVLYGNAESEATREAIAKALNLEVSDLWPNNNNHRKAAA
jgi:transcriptional regulator with XRE-family HTH domain